MRDSERWIAERVVHAALGALRSAWDLVLKPPSEWNDDNVMWAGNDGEGGGAVRRWLRLETDPWDRRRMMRDSSSAVEVLLICW